MSAPSPVQRRRIQGRNIAATTLLSPVQRRYIWLAGSYPKLVLVQGRGYRSRRLKYALDEDSLIVFGYQNPAYFLEQRGMFRKLQSLNHYALTEDGEGVFLVLLAAGAGAKINQEIELVRVHR